MTTRKLLFSLLVPNIDQIAGITVFKGFQLLTMHVLIVVPKSPMRISICQPMTLVKKYFNNPTLLMPL